MKLYYTQTEPFAPQHLQTLNNRGYEPVHLPFRRIEPADQSICNPCTFEMIVVSSKHAARWLRHFQADELPPVAAVGRATSAELSGYALYFGDDPPPNAAELVARLQRNGADPTRLLFVRGEHALSTIPDGLRGIQEQVVYRGETIAGGGLKGQQLEPEAVLYFQSPSAVTDFLRVYPRTPHWLAAIGPSTAAAVRKRGLTVDFQPSRPETTVFTAELPAPRYFVDLCGGQDEPKKESS